MNHHRSFLILFGVYAGYDIDCLNKALRESGFDELSRSNRLDNSIIDIVEYEVIKFMRHTVNTVNFLHKIEPEDDPRSMGHADQMFIGEIERADYEERIQEIVESLDLKNYLEYETEKNLVDIFNAVLTKKTFIDISSHEFRELIK